MSQAPQGNNSENNSGLSIRQSIAVALAIGLTGFGLLANSPAEDDTLLSLGKSLSPTPVDELNAPTFSLKNMRAACAPLFATGAPGTNVAKGVQCSLSPEAISVRTTGLQTPHASLNFIHEYGIGDNNPKPKSHFAFTGLTVSLPLDNAAVKSILFRAYRNDEPGDYLSMSPSVHPLSVQRGEVPTEVFAVVDEVRAFAAEALERVRNCNATMPVSKQPLTPVRNDCGG